MSLFSPNRLSTPTIKKFSSPNCAFGSRMSRDPRSNAETLLSMLFFDDCHCQAPPVSASADTAIRAAATRPATTVLLRRPRRGLDCAELRPRPTRDGCTRSRRRSAARSGTSEAYPATTGITSVSPDLLSRRRTASMTSVGGAGGAGAAGGGSAARSGRGRLSSSGTLAAPCTLAIRSATVTPSVWLPVWLRPARRPRSRNCRLRSHGAAPGDGRGASGKPLIVAASRPAAQAGRAARSGVVAVTHVPTGLRLFDHRARRCAWAYAVSLSASSSCSSTLRAPPLEPDTTRLISY